MTDKDLRRDVLDELDFDPSLDAADIGVAVSDGVVTLTGHVGSYDEKVETERAVKRVKGVRAIAQEIQVRLPNAKAIEDDQIAARALAIIDWSVHLPKDAIQVKVARGPGSAYWRGAVAIPSDGRRGGGAQAVRSRRRLERHRAQAKRATDGRQGEDP